MSLQPFSISNYNSRGVLGGATLARSAFVLSGGKRRYRLLLYKPTMRLLYDDCRDRKVKWNGRYVYFVHHFGVVCFTPVQDFGRVGSLERMSLQSRRGSGELNSKAICTSLGEGVFEVQPHKHLELSDHVIEMGMTAGAWYRLKKKV